MQNSLPLTEDIEDLSNIQMSTVFKDFKPVFTESLLEEIMKMEDIDESSQLPISIENQPLNDFLETPMPMPNQCAVIGSNTALVPYQSPLVNSSLTGTVPSNKEFAGKYNFEIILDSSTSRFHWVYSDLLNKVYISMDQVLPVEFRWDNQHPELPVPLLVRAMPLYALPQHSSEPVHRCLNHTNKMDKSNINQPEHVHPHIVRCLDNSTRYCCYDGRLSVLTQLGPLQPGTPTFRLMYKFMCKNSCTSGMNRRPVEIVYTLETTEGAILGRRKHELRICSCPKRDKQKEEAEKKGKPSKKRKLVKPPTNEEPVEKKSVPVVKLETNNTAVERVKNDLQVFTIQMTGMSPVEVVGIETVRAMYREAYNTMAANAYRLNAIDVYQPFLDNLEQKIHSLGNQ